MKNRLLLLSLALAALPACQSQYKEIVEDQDRQLEAMQAERQRLLTERDRVRAENAALQEQLTVEQIRARELNDRIRAMEASPVTQEPDLEVDNLRGRLEGHGISVERRAGFIVLDLPSAITFPSGGADLSSKGRRSLAAVVEVLQTGYTNKTFWVEGHTDNDPISKSAWKSNLHLSVMRAMAVASYLTRQLSIQPDQIRVAGHGEFAPKVENLSPENKASNRRVEILILD